MLNGKVPVSSICSNGSSSEDYFMFNMKKFMIRVIEIIFSSNDLNNLIANLEGFSENNFTNMKAGK